MRVPVTEADRALGDVPYFGANGQQGWIDRAIFNEPLVIVAEDGGHFDDPSRGVAYRIHGPAWVNNHGHVLRAKAHVDTDFLFRALQNYDFQPYISGSTRSKLTQKQLLAALIPLPPLPEQRRIAAILDRADALRAKRRQIGLYFDALTRSIFHDMCGAQNWPRESLGDRLEFLTSGSRGWAKYYAPTGEKFIRIQNVKGGYLDEQDMAHVIAPDTAEARRTAVQAGDVLLSITADLGRTAVVPDGVGAAYINQHLALLRAPSLTPRYLADFLASPAGQREVLGKDRGATKAGLNFDDVRSVSIPIPPADVQARYAEQVERVDRQRGDILAVQATWDELFASLQARAFAGDL
jgi:type I restriction enzyme S subunit